MKRSFLTALGLEKEQIDQIMSEHGSTVELIKEKNQETVEKQVEKLNTKIAELQEKVDNAPTGDNGNLEEKYNALKTEYDEYKAGVDAEKTTASKQSILRGHLEKDGANPKLIKLIEREFDLSKLEVDGEKIKDWDFVSKPIKEAYADVFGVTQTKSADVATPPGENTGEEDPFIAGFNE